MKLYFSPLACSLAVRIAFYEANAVASYVEVDPMTKLTSDGRDFCAIHHLALVPVLELGPGDVLSENAAVLQFIAGQYPEAQLAPRGARDQARLQQWLSFIGTELHKAIFAPLLERTASAEAKAYASSKVEQRLRWLETQLQGREFLLDRFTVADAYLFAVLNWSQVTAVDLEPCPAILAYHRRLSERTSVARAFAEERVLYVAELARNAAAERSASLPEASTSSVIERFNAAFQRHDPAALESLVADGCVLENTQPAPNGSRHVGRSACLEVWQTIARNREAHFELEQTEVQGERALIYWRYRWGAAENDCVRGVNLMRVRHGQIIEGAGYVKGA